MLLFPQPLVLLLGFLLRLLGLLLCRPQQLYLVLQGLLSGLQLKELFLLLLPGLLPVLDEDLLEAEAFPRDLRQLLQGLLSFRPFSLQVFSQTMPLLYSSVPSQQSQTPSLTRLEGMYRGL